MVGPTAVEFSISVVKSLNPTQMNSGLLNDISSLDISDKDHADLGGDGNVSTSSLQGQVGEREEVTDARNVYFCQLFEIAVFADIGSTDFVI